ncbi:hypothetical protein [Nocardia rhizosphaerae]|uniref:Uncharacterized protein n=1 Tax=Nocardia rhizosphaerae TaxID=1691571 RepID=A0ABV8LE48_9NOCA
MSPESADRAAALAIALDADRVGLFGEMYGTDANLRAGLVVRSVIERRSPVLGGRAIGKIVSDAYLLRDGGTEFE